MTMYYMRTELANLSGKAFHKKKNHVSRFLRTYNDTYVNRMCKLGTCYECCGYMVY